MLPHDRGSALQVDAGEVIVVPQGETHMLGSCHRPVAQLHGAVVGESGGDDAG